MLWIQFWFYFYRALISSSVIILDFVPESAAAKINREGGKLQVGDIIRSIDGFHVNLDNVNSFLLQKLSSSISSNTAKVKLIVQRAKVKARKKRLSKKEKEGEITTGTSYMYMQKASS